MAIAEALETFGIKNTKAIKTIETTIGGISGAISLFTTVISISEKLGKLFGLWNSDNNSINNEIEEIKTAIRELKNAVPEAVRANIDIEKRTHISNQLGPIYTSIDKANDFYNDTSDQSKNRLVNAVDNAQSAINSLLMEEGEDGYFRQLFIESLLYRAWDGEILLPPDVDVSHTEIWDYRYTLPCILKAISMYLFATGIVEQDPKNYTKIYGNELKKWADRLLAIHDKIKDGIVPIRAPSHDELVGIDLIAVTVNDVNGEAIITSYGSENNPTYLTEMIPTYKQDQGGLTGSVWYNCGQIYGAVERYSAYPSIGHWPQLSIPESPYCVYMEGTYPETIYRGEEIEYRDRHWVIYRSANSPPPPSEFFKQFYARHALATLKKCKDVYSLVGLQSVWNIINQLRILSGNPPLRENPWVNWSIREVDQVVGKAGFERPSTAEAGQPISMRNIASILGTLPPFSLRNMFAQPI